MGGAVADRNFFVGGGVVIGGVVGMDGIVVDGGCVEVGVGCLTICTFLALVNMVVPLVSFSKRRPSCQV